MGLIKKTLPNQSKEKENPLYIIRPIQSKHILSMQILF